MASDDGPSVGEVWAVTAIAGIGLVYLMWWIIKIMFYVCVGIGMGLVWLWNWNKERAEKNRQEAERLAKLPPPPVPAMEFDKIKSVKLRSDPKLILERIRVLRRDVAKLQEHPVTRVSPKLHNIQADLKSAKRNLTKARLAGDEVAIKRVSKNVMAIHGKMQFHWGQSLKAQRKRAAA